MSRPDLIKVGFGSGSGEMDDRRRASLLGLLNAASIATQAIAPAQGGSHRGYLYPHPFLPAKRSPRPVINPPTSNPRGTKHSVDSLTGITSSLNQFSKRPTNMGISPFFSLFPRFYLIFIPSIVLRDLSDGGFPFDDTGRNSSSMVASSDSAPGYDY